MNKNEPFDAKKRNRAIPIQPTLFVAAGLALRALPGKPRLIFMHDTRQYAPAANDAAVRT